MIKNVLVVGGGSAGFIAAITLKSKLPQLSVTVMRSKELGIIGVGEGTTAIVPDHLHNYCGIPLDEFYRGAEPQWKLGTRFRWGKRPYFDYAFGGQICSQHDGLSHALGYYVPDDQPFDCVGMYSAMMSACKVFRRAPNGAMVHDNSLAYHLENERFVSYLETYALRIGIKIEEDTVRDVHQGDSGVAALHLASGRTATADLYVDCTGFRSLLISKTFGEKYHSFKDTLFCDRAVVGGWQRTDEPIWPFTAADTMNAGWAWQIEHEHRINRGYVYSSAFISDEDAEREFRAVNPKLGPTRIVKFVSGRYERAWVGNVVGIGNSIGFVEPLEATAIATICNMSKWVTLTLTETELNPCQFDRDLFNRAVTGVWETIRAFLGTHYKFNTRIDTPFWRECWEKTNLGSAAELVEFYQERGPSVLWNKLLLDKVDTFGMEGYLSTLLGQLVPYRMKHQPVSGEDRVLARLRQTVGEITKNAVSVPEALGRIRSPQFQWRKSA